MAGNAAGLTERRPNAKDGCNTNVVLNDRRHRGLERPVFTNRDGGLMSLADMRRALRVAMPDDPSWVTPHSFRRTVATVMSDAHGPAAASQQLSHAKPFTTEAH